MPKETARRILKKHKFESYKVSHHQELRPGDAERRLEFAEAILEREDEDPGFTSRILFTDEKSFTLHHAPNTQNCRLWATSNPHAVFTDRGQYRGSVNVWGGILNENVVGPVWIDGVLTGQSYLDLLQGEIGDRVTALPLPDKVWFMHDGCPAHNYGPATLYLRDAFAGNVIGTHEPLAWPARSPDLNPMDSFLWGHTTSVVHNHAAPFPNAAALRDRIQDAFAAITPVQLQQVQRDFVERLQYCVAADGQLFENLIN